MQDFRGGGYILLPFKMIKCHTNKELCRKLGVLHYKSMARILQKPAFNGRGVPPDILPSEVTILVRYRAELERGEFFCEVSYKYRQMRRKVLLFSAISLLNIHRNFRKKARPFHCPITVI